MSPEMEIVERDNGTGRLPLVPTGEALQQVRTAYATAVRVQVQRRLQEVQRRVLEEARLAGEEFYYGWGAGKDQIEGPSVKLALALARCWGNCAVEALPVQDLPDCWIFSAAFVDLETGFTLTRQFRQSKRWTVHGRHDEERKDDIRFQIGQSKAVRNVLLNALPSSLVARALAAAKEGVRAELEELVKKYSLVTVADRLLVALGKCGVPEALVLAKCNVAEKRALTLDHLTMLRGDLKAIQEGQERPGALFPRAEGEVTGEPQPQPEAPPQPAKGRRITKKAVAAIESLSAKLQLSEADWEEMLQQHSLRSLADATAEQGDSILTLLGNAVREREGGREPGEDEPEED